MPLKLIPNWKKAYKSLAVLLPTIGSFILLIVHILQTAGELSLIPQTYMPHVTAFVIPTLSWVGRIISQGDLFKIFIEDKEDDSETE